MDYFLNDEQKRLKKVARTIGEKLILPKREQLDENEEFPWDIIKILGKEGLLGIAIPKEYGGLGKGTFENTLVVEEISKFCMGVSVCFAGSGLAAYPIMLYGTEEQKKRYLPPIARGEDVAAFGLTEAQAGSDAGGLLTTATKVEGGYIINGTKQWITNGGEAETYIIVALTDKSKGPRGASAFILRRDMEGFSFGKKEKKMGIRASATRELIFQNCFVPKENLLGKEGLGFFIAMKVLDRTRPGIGAQAIGVCQGALDAAINYARKRRQFERPILSFQAIQHMLADMATLTEAARALVYSVCRYIDSNPKEFSKASAMAKVFPSDVAMKVTIDAIQVLGGRGYMKDYPTEKMLRDAKVLQIYEGTNQIQRNVIARHLLKEYASADKELS